MSIELLVAVVGILGVIVGGVVQHLATTKHERWKYQVEMRTEAYKSLMNSIANLALYNGFLSKSASNPDNSQIERILSCQVDMAAAQTKIALYGSQEVIEKAGKFYSKHAGLVEDADYEAFIDMVEAMRADSFVENYDGFRQNFDDLMLRGALKS